MEDGSFVRLKNVTLGYTLPNLDNAQRLGIKLYVSAQNLVTLTDYQGFDPGASSTSAPGNASATDAEAGLDLGAYPAARVYTVGLNINF